MSEDFNEERLKEDLERDNKTLEETNKDIELVEQELENKQSSEQDKKLENISNNLNVDKETLKTLIDQDKILGDGSGLDANQKKVYEQFKKFMTESKSGKYL